LGLFWAANGAAYGGEDEGGPDDLERDVAIMENAGEPSVAPAGT
jgi:hypothetical protein